MKVIPAGHANKRGKFKLASVMWLTLSTQQPTYLVNLLHFSRTLRSSVTKQLFIPKTKLSIGKRAFPTIWNQLPITIRSSENYSHLS